MNIYLFTIGETDDFGRIKTAFSYISQDAPLTRS